MLRDLLVQVASLKPDPTKTEETQLGVMTGVTKDPITEEVGVAVEDIGEIEVAMKGTEAGTPMEGSPEGDLPEEGVTTRITMITKSRVFSKG